MNVYFLKLVEFEIWGMTDKNRQIDLNKNNMKVSCLIDRHDVMP